MTSMSHPVKDLIHERLESGSQPGLRDDDARLALVVEGGGMRGVVSSGMCSALEEMGMRDVFDAIYGTSAGAFNAAYFNTRQSRFSSTIYFEDANNRRFIDVKRLLVPGQTVMDLEFLVFDVVATPKST